MTILITGATGFVGSNLLPYLKAHMPAVKIVSLGRKSTGAPGDLVWDDLGAGNLVGVNAIIHLAGKAHDTKNTSAAGEYLQVNYELTRKLYDLFLRSDATNFIYLSSVKAAADTVTGILTEAHTSDPQTPYGQSKLKAEQYLIQNSSSQIPNPTLTRELTTNNEQLTTILRPCMIHGPGNKGNLNLLYKVAQKGIPYPLAAFDNKRSFLGIDNLNFVIRQLLEQPVENGVYNVADDEPLATTDLIRLMAKVQHKSPKLWNVPEGMIKAAAKVGDFLKLPLNTERLKKLTESYIVSNKKIKTAFGIKHMPTSAREGLIKTLKSF